jgi:hypothetical protein
MQGVRPGRRHDVDAGILTIRYLRIRYDGPVSLQQSADVRDELCLYKLGRAPRVKPSSQPNSSAHLFHYQPTPSRKSLDSQLKPPT